MHTHQVRPRTLVDATSPATAVAGRLQKAAAMAERLRVGDRVTWRSHGGTAEGRIVRVATEDGTIGDFEYRASPEHPKYIVETDEGRRAAHEADALTRE